MPALSRFSLTSAAAGSSVLPDDRDDDDRPKSSSSVEKTIALANIPGSSTARTDFVDAEPGLPPPVLHRPARKRTSEKKLRIGRESVAITDRMRLHLARFLRKVGNGTAPSSSSVIDDTTSESTAHHCQGRSHAQDGDPDGLLDEVVVDREWGEELQKTTSATHSDHGGTPEKGGGSNHHGGTSTDRDSITAHVHANPFWASCTVLAYLRWRMWPGIITFFWTSFVDEHSEQRYKKENWFLRKVRPCA